MKKERVFSTMSPEAAKFYHRLFNEVLLNMYAVQDGFYDTFLCEMDDPHMVRRWRDRAPTIIEAMIIHKQRQQRAGE